MPVMTMNDLFRQLTSSEYPATAKEVLNPPVVFRQSVVDAMKVFKAEKPYRGSLEERMGKFMRLHQKLNAIYSKNTRLVFDSIGDEDSGSSHYNQPNDSIVLQGKMSIITYLHEYSHVINGRSEKKAVRWSLNLFRKTFPKLFEKLKFEGYVGRAANQNPPNPDNAVEVAGVPVQKPIQIKEYQREVGV